MTIAAVNVVNDPLYQKDKFVHDMQLLLAFYTMLPWHWATGYRLAAEVNRQHSECVCI